MNNLNEIESIAIETDNMKTYFIERKDIIDLDLKSKVVLIEDPEELKGFTYNVIEDGLIVVNNLNSFSNFETGNSFDYKKEKITKLMVRKKENNLKTLYVDFYENGEIPNQLIDINEKGNVFITIQDLYKE